MMLPDRIVVQSGIEGFSVFKRELRKVFTVAGKVFGRVFVTGDLQISPVKEPNEEAEEEESGDGNGDIEGATFDQTGGAEAGSGQKSTGSNEVNAGEDFGTATTERLLQLVAEDEIVVRGANLVLYVFIGEVRI